jgi:hypothetical protein
LVRREHAVVILQAGADGKPGEPGKSIPGKVGQPGAAGPKGDVSAAGPPEMSLTVGTYADSDAAVKALAS